MRARLTVALVLTAMVALTSCSESSGTDAEPGKELNTDCEASFKFEDRTYVNAANQGIEQVKLGKAIGFGYSLPCFDSDGTSYMNEHRFFRYPGVPVREAILFKDGGRGDVLVNVEQAGRNTELPDYLYDDLHTYE